MGLFGNLFGGYEARKKKADGLFEARHFGPAKLAYENALSSAPEQDRDALAQRITTCRDGIAEGRIAEAERQIEQDAPDLAQLELDGALEVAASSELRAEARRLLDSLEREDAQREVEEEQELGDDAILALLAGQWEEQQGEEYDRLGEPLFDALVQMHRGDFEGAQVALEQLVSEAKIPRYAWLELARVRLMLDDDEAAKQAFTTFLDSLDPDEGGEARLAAHVELARLEDAAGDFEAAMAQLADAVEAFEGDPRPYFLMGNFLRQKQLYDEAVDVLRSAAAVMDEQQPDWRVLTELGLALRDAEQPAEAIARLEEVVDLFSQRGVLDFPADAVIPLAELQEARGKLDRAADLWASLASGSRHDLKAHCHREAGRLLAELGLMDEARRMLTRAGALAEDDAELTADIQERLAALPDD
ncbi:MAG: tetratricopeptide repeat protein [Deltaproteobacteria bacterium]|nr:tetratricopeptide repeat protein [Deltaproteobacteria bacterium]